MDNFSAHNASHEQLQRKAATKLQNTKVIFLPPNVTSRHQPLDQEIIHSWKAQYKRKWLAFMVSEADEGRDALDKMDVLKAIRWGINAWHNDVTNDTVRNCWIKSGLLGPVEGPLLKPKGYQPFTTVASPLPAVPEVIELDPIHTEIASLLRTVATQRTIQIIPSIDEFLEPDGERVYDDEEAVDEQVLADIIEAYDDEEQEDTEGEDPDLNFKKITLDEMIAAQAIAIQWEEQNGDGDGNELLALERKMAKLQLQKSSQKGKQTPITQWFGKG